MECELVRVQRLCFAFALGLPEETFDRVVEVAVEDGFEAAFGCVELFCRTISIIPKSTTWIHTYDGLV